MRLHWTGLFQRRKDGLRPDEAKAGAPVSVLGQGFQGSGFTGQSFMGQARGYAALSRQGFLRNAVAHRCVRMVSEAAATVPFLVFEDGAERQGHPMEALIARPNPRQAGPEFLEALYGHLMLSGNAFVEPVLLGGRLRELYLIRPDRVRIAEGRDGWPEALLVDGPKGGIVARRLPFRGEAGDPVHIRLFHPLSEHYGFAPLAAAGVALDLSNAASAWNKALLDNSARPSGALVYQPKEGGNLSPAQYERLKQELEEGYTGTLSAGRPLLLEGGLDWKPMAMTPRDMDFTEARNGAARDIALAMGVPPMLLGIPGDNTYANYQEAHRAFYRLTVLPLVARTLAALAHGLAPENPGLRLEADPDQVAALSPERTDLWTRVGAADFLSQAEKRQATGYGPAPDDGF